MVIRHVQLHVLLLEAQHSAGFRSLVDALVELQTISHFRLSSQYWLTHPTLKWRNLIHACKVCQNSAFHSLVVQYKDLCTCSRILPHSPTKVSVTFKECCFRHIVLQQEGRERKGTGKEGGSNNHKKNVSAILSCRSLATSHSTKASKKNPKSTFSQR